MDTVPEFNLLKDKQSDIRTDKRAFVRFFTVRNSLILLISLFLTALIISVAIIYFSLPDVDFLKTKNPELTALMKFRQNQARQKGKKLFIQQEWISFDRIPGLLKQAVRLSEDTTFYSHHGIDFFELKESIKKNLQKGKKARGGSTITMQLAKNLFLSPEKSYVRKIKEFIIAKRLEKALSKKRIFHLYLNIVELGRGIFGFQAAARYYFDKSLEDLHLTEILRLVAMLPKPLRVDPKSDSRYLRWRINYLGDLMFRTDNISIEDYHLIKAEFN